MSFQIEWEDEAKTIIHFHLPETFTWEEQNDAVRDLVNELTTVDHTVYLIVRMENARIPKGNPFPHFQYFNTAMPDHVGAVVTVGADGFAATMIRTFARAYARINRLENHLVTSLDEAHAIIEQTQKALAE